MVSKNYKNWISKLDPKTCADCLYTHGKIFGINEIPDPNIPLHIFCRCIIVPMEAVKAGTATQNKFDGADFWLKYKKSLPEYYITEKQASDSGYIPILGNLSVVAPNKMFSKGVYNNRNGHLPSAPGRVWFEADINYKSGYRNSQRILYSNDGLMFATYDHYKTFVEIV